jgi:hypothetical protein
MYRATELALNELFFAVYFSYQASELELLDWEVLA